MTNVSAPIVRALVAVALVAVNTVRLAAAWPFIVV
jgi:hypothetical protein